MDARTNVRTHTEEVELGLPDGALGAISLGQWMLRRARGEMILHEPSQVSALQHGAQARRAVWEQGNCNYDGGTLT
jgi:hypothetical protein